MIYAGSSPMDDFLLKLGAPGRYQLFVFFILITCFFSAIVQNHMLIFMTIPPPHQCKLPEGWSWPRNESIPDVYNMGVKSSDECHLFVDPGNKTKGVMPCPEGHDYYPAVGEWTIVPEWQLVCDEAYLVDLVTTISFSGMTLGNILSGPLADWLGRRPTLLLALYAQLLSSLALAYANSYVVFVILRFLLSIWLQSVMTSSYTLAIELFHSRYRTLAGAVLGVTMPVSLGILAGIATYVRFWRHLQLIFSLSSLVSVIYFWLFPESLRWLVSKGRVDEAHSVAEKYVRFNRPPPIADLRAEVERLTLQVLAESTAKRKKYNKDANFLYLFKTPRLALITTTGFYSWFAAEVTYVGFNYYVTKLKTDVPISFVIYSVIECVGVILIFPIMARFGRRPAIILTLLISGLTCLALAIVQIFVREGRSILEVILAGTSKLFACTGYIVLCIHSTELYPTVVRNFGLAFSCVFSRGAGIVSPQLLLLGRETWRPLSFFIFAFLTLTSSILYIFVPETLGKPMPETMEDVNKLWLNTQPEEQRKPEVEGEKDKEGNGSKTDETSLSDNKDNRPMQHTIGGMHDIMTHANNSHHLY